MDGGNDSSGRSARSRCLVRGAGFSVPSPLAAQPLSAVCELAVGRSHLIDAPPDDEWFLELASQD
jgi:hypothetical protein